MPTDGVEDRVVAVVAEDPMAQLQSLLSHPTAKARRDLVSRSALLQLFEAVPSSQLLTREQLRSKFDNPPVHEFCEYSTRDVCDRMRKQLGQHTILCQRIHFEKVIKSYTDETLGDCSYLETCRNPHSCKLMHYRIDVRDALRVKEYECSLFDGLVRRQPFVNFMWYLLILTG
jgi:mRNA (2'-O-methyladenosine-N6-)-methyltransferase